VPVLSAINIRFCRNKRAPELASGPHAYQARIVDAKVGQNVRISL